MSVDVMTAKLVDGDPLHGVSGLIERGFIAAALAWITVVSRRVLAAR